MFPTKHFFEKCNRRIGIGKIAPYARKRDISEPNDHNISTRHIVTLLGATCCARLATLDVAWCCSRLARLVQQCCARACALVRFSTANMSQHVEPNNVAICCVQMLRSFAGPCKCWANNVGICCVVMLRSFGGGFIHTHLFALLHRFAKKLQSFSF